MIPGHDLGDDKILLGSRNVEPEEKTKSASQYIGWTENGELETSR